LELDVLGATVTTGAGAGVATGIWISVGTAICGDAALTGVCAAGAEPGVACLFDWLATGVAPAGVVGARAIVCATEPAGVNAGSTAADGALVLSLLRAFACAANVYAALRPSVEEIAIPLVRMRAERAGCLSRFGARESVIVFILTLITLIIIIIIILFVA
jgi:hypothetical protein